VAGLPERVYVPDALADAVDVIDPATFRLVARLPVGEQPTEVRPDWDLRKLWVNLDGSDSLAEINPRLGRVVRTVRVPDPTHLYFTPDGRRAIVVAGRDGRVDVRDRRSWQLERSVSVPGVEDLDISADGRSALLGTQGGSVVGLDLGSGRLTGSLALGGSCADVQLSPSGHAFFVADQARGGVSIVAAGTPRDLGFIRTAPGASGMALSRSTRSLFVANRSSGTISVIDVAHRRLRRSWLTGGSPDELQVSPDGRQLWVSGRYDGAVYVLDTASGAVLHVIRVGAGPERLSFFPEPGHHSVGHDYR